MVTQQESATASIAEVLVASLKRFGRFGSSYPIYVAAPSGAEVVRTAELFEKENLRRASERAILEWTSHPEEEDVRAAFSRFWRRYCDSLALPLILPLANGVALDFSFARTSFVISGDMPHGVVVDLAGAELFTCDERPSSWTVHGTKLRTAEELRERAQGNVLGQHFQVVIDHVLESVRVSRGMLWAGLAEAIDLGYDAAVDHYTAEEYAPLKEDRDRLLFGATLPRIPGANPLAGQLKWEHIPGFKRPQQVRKICCFNYVVPSRPEPYCRTCGVITREERLMIWGRFARDPKAKDSLIDPPLVKRRG